MHPLHPLVTLESGLTLWSGDALWSWLTLLALDSCPVEAVPARWAGWAGVTFELGARRSGRHEVGDGIDDECRSTARPGDVHAPQAGSGQVRDHVVPRPVPSTVTLPAAFSSVSTNRIVLSDTPGTARRMSAIVNWAGACNST